MKTLDEISRLTAEDLERISQDGSTPVPEELPSRIAAALPGRKPARKWILPAGIAAALVAVSALGLSLKGEPEPKDTFSDPYLAYAEVEKAFDKISSTLAYGAGKVSEAEQHIENIENIWK